MKYKFWKLNIFKDDRGSLCPVEFFDLPFKPKRIYFVFDVKELRGSHAHRKEQEIFICLNGSFRARLHNGKKYKTFKMSAPGEALYVPNLIWHAFDKFSKDAIMLAITSTPYKGKKGYIMDFDQFKKLCGKKS